jgi:hypothetical protein
MPAVGFTPASHLQLCMGSGKPVPVFFDEATTVLILSSKSVAAMAQRHLVNRRPSSKKGIDS